MKIWLVATTDIDYDLYRAAVIIAASKEKAEKIAWAAFTRHPWQSIGNVADINVNELNFGGYGKANSLQNWHAQEINLDDEHIVLADFNAG